MDDWVGGLFVAGWIVFEVWITTSLPHSHGSQTPVQARKIENLSTNPFLYFALTSGLVSLTFFIVSNLVAGILFAVVGFVNLVIMFSGWRGSR
jgi:hypothetical protein